MGNDAIRADRLLAELPEKGLKPEHISGVVTAGELAHRFMSRQLKKLGNRVIWIAWADMKERGLSDYFSGLEGYTLAKHAERADFLLVSGAETIFAGTENEQRTNYEKDGDLLPFQPMFRRAIARALPMVVANPHETVRGPGNSLAFHGGSLAQHYQRLGGRVLYFGKPYTGAFEEAQRLLDEIATDADVEDKICHIGDSLTEDIAGAAAVGLDTAWVLKSGMHAEDIPDDFSSQDIKKLCKEHKTDAPSAVLSRFEW